jgi:hypothetical protein
MSDFSHLPPPEYERHDVDVAGVGRTLVLLGVISALALLATFGFYRYMQRDEQAGRAPLPAVAQQESVRRPPEPRLQTAPYDDIVALRARERRHLSQYRWVVKDRVARLPIEEAMKLYAERAAAGRAGAPFTLPMAAPSPATPAVAAGARP